MTTDCVASLHPMYLEAGRRRRRRRRLFTYFTADWLRTHAHSTTLGLRDCREPGRPSNAAVDGPATSTGVQVNRDQLTADDRSVSNRSLRRPASCEGCRDIRPPGYLPQDRSSRTCTSASVCFACRRERLLLSFISSIFRKCCVIVNN